MERTERTNRSSRFFLLISIVVVVASLYLARDVLIPIALSILLSFLLSPPVGWLERIHVPRPAATSIVVLLALGAVVGVGYLTGRQASDIVAELPNYQGQLKAKIHRIGEHGGFFRKASQEVKSLTSSITPATTAPSISATQPSFWSGLNPASTEPAASQPSADNPMPVRNYPAPQTPLEMMRDYASTALAPLAIASLVIVLVFFMLLSREDLRDRLIRLAGSGRLHVTTQAMDEASTRITHYLGALAIVNGCYAGCVAIGLWLIGVTLGGGRHFPNVLVWGLLVGLFRFVPYIGVWVGAGVTLLLGFALYPDNDVFFAMVGMYIFIEIIVSQFVEPTWYGATTGISPLAVLVAAVFWGWLWGGIGLLLSTPLTVLLVVIGKYVPQFKFLDILLRDTPVLSMPYRFYQRLIALDAEEAASLARDHLAETRSLEAVYDEVLVPALALAEQDRYHERISLDQWRFFRQTVHDLVEELGELATTASADPSARSDAKTDVPDQTLLASATSKLAAAASSVATAASSIAQAMTGGTKDSSIEATERTREGRSHLPAGCPINVLCVPARDEADEIVAQMFAQLLESRGYCAIAPGAAVLASEMVDLLEKKDIDLVCISAMPPGAVAHSRYLSKRIASKHPDLPTIVGLWTYKGDLEKARDRVAGGRDARFVTSLKDAQEQLEQLAHPLIVRATSSIREPDQPSTAEAPAPVAV